MNVALRSVLAALFGLLPLVAMSAPAGTQDVFYGPAGSSQQDWDAWFQSMLAARERARSQARFDPTEYLRPDAQWSRHVFRQFLLFIYDEGLYDREQLHYRTEELLGEWRARYGAVDSVLLWQGYPRLGFDTRNQFAFYRDMPGGLAAVRREVSDVLHAHGARVFLDYNPWDASGDLENDGHRREYEELAAIVKALDADGIMLDTLSVVPASLKRAIEAVKGGVVFSPEDRPADYDLSFVTQSWAQWTDRGDGRPSLYRSKWIVPEHRQFAIRRWDMDRREDITYSFVNGSGLLVWDNIFGSWNPYSATDRHLIAETGAVLTSYASLLADGQWLPLVPAAEGLEAHVWRAQDGRRLTLLRNRGDTPAVWVEREPVPPGLTAIRFWPSEEVKAADGGLDHSYRVVVQPGGVQAVAYDRPDHAREAYDAFLHARRDTLESVPNYDERTPTPRLVAPPWAPATVEAGASNDMREIRGGRFAMTIAHPRRESGCYPFGTAPSQNALWGWNERDTLIHQLDVEVKPFRMKRTAVTNDEFLEFVAASGYVPADPQNFLKQIPREKDGRLPRHAHGWTLGDLPVTWVSLADARAYAQWHGERLPSEAEWQWAAEGAGAGNRWPWGSDDAKARDKHYVNLAGKLADADANSRGKTPQGVIGLTGNAWELTESEYDDGHNRFVMLRGGVFLPKAESEWVVDRGPRPNSFHAKYLLMGEGLDRSDTVSFRTVR